MNKNRLLKLINVLQNVDPAEFDMNEWVVYKAPAFCTFDPVQEILIPDLKFHCKTVACAIGNYILHEKPDDLHIILDGRNNPAITNLNAKDPKIKDVLHRGFHSVPFIAKHFKLSIAATVYIFYHDYYKNPEKITPNEVVRHVKNVMNGTFTKQYAQKIMKMEKDKYWG